MGHPELLADFLHQKSGHFRPKGRGSVKIKTLRSQTHKLLVREKGRDTTFDGGPSERSMKQPSTSSFVPTSSEFRLIRPLPRREIRKRPPPATASMSPRMTGEPSPTASFTSKGIAESPRLSSSPEPSMPSVRKYLPQTSGEKIERYEAVVGELKEAIAKQGGRSDEQQEHYIKPSDIARTFNRRIPPNIPPPPPADSSGPTFAERPLRHVSPPATPQLGRVVETSVGRVKNTSKVRQASKTAPEGAYANSLNMPAITQDIDKRQGHSASAFTHQRFPSSGEKHDLKIGSHGTEILRYLPDRLPGGQSKFLASDGTEWDIIVIEPHEDELAVLRKILAEQDGMSGALQLSARSEDLSDIFKRAGEPDVSAPEAA